MRNRFGNWLVSAANRDDRLRLLAGDIGFGIFDEFISKHPDKFINCGIAEQNMIGVAAGMAANGLRPFVYTIIPFLIYRPYEFVRNLIAYQNLPVVIVGVGGGFSYDSLGHTHYGLEDINLISDLPNFTTEIPFDPKSVEMCSERALFSSKPSYIRLMKGGEPEIQMPKPLSISASLECVARYGEHYTIFTHGGLVHEALNAVRILHIEHGISGGVVAATCSNLTEIDRHCLGDLYVFEENKFPGIFYKSVEICKKIINAKSIVFATSESKLFYEREKILSNQSMCADSMIRHVLSNTKY
jgi:transketolase